ncbi:MAG: M67 family metallopeptidase, partial [Lentisphaeria bacterium]|nr:M67 family metallopeptidase [Lentisphaeria bacterium]
MLKLSRQIENEIRQAGADAYPNECCGIMFGSGEGDDHAVKLLRPIVNAREDGEQYHRCLITAEDMMQAELEARRLGLEIVGFYHSHPDH